MLVLGVPARGVRFVLVGRSVVTPDTPIIRAVLRELLAEVKAGPFGAQLGNQQPEPEGGQILGR
ncbi:hypothetical protein D9M68_911510 [compost metagenome]